MRSSMQLFICYRSNITVSFRSIFNRCGRVRPLPQFVLVAQISCATAVFQNSISLLPVKPAMSGKARPTFWFRFVRLRGVPRLLSKSLWDVSESLRDSGYLRAGANLIGESCRRFAMAYNWTVTHDVPFLTLTRNSPALALAPRHLSTPNKKGLPSLRSKPFQNVVSSAGLRP